MTIIEIQIEEKNKILKGLEKAYEKLLEFKRTKNSELVVMIDNKIVKIKPDQKQIEEFWLHLSLDRYAAASWSIVSELLRKNNQNWQIAAL